MRLNICYLPGLISLMLFAPLCLNHLYNRDVFKKYYIIKMSAFNHSQLNNGNDRYVIRPSLPNRVFKKFAFSGVKEQDEQMLNRTKDAINELKTSGNTHTAIELVFTRHTTYQTFIATLDLCRNKGVAWLLVDCILYAWYEPPALMNRNKTIEVDSFCGTGIEEQEQLFARINEERILGLNKKIVDIIWQMWPSWLLLAILIFYSRQAIYAAIHPYRRTPLQSAKTDAANH